MKTIKLQLTDFRVKRIRLYALFTKYDVQMSNIQGTWTSLETFDADKLPQARALCRQMQETQNNRG